MEISEIYNPNDEYENFVKANIDEAEDRKPNKLPNVLFHGSV